MKRLNTVVPIAIALLVASLCSCSWNNPYAAGYLAQTAPAAPTSRWIESTLNPLFGDSGHRAYYPCVVKVGSTYHIWYGDGSTTRHAASAFVDFHDFVFPAPEITVGGTSISAVFPSGPIYHPSVCYNAAGWTINGVSTADPIVMYIAENLQGPMRVLHSADGSNWTQFTAGGACTGLAAGAYNLSVLYEGGIVWKAYSEDGSPHLYYYTSTDGYNWTVKATDFLGTYQTAWESSPPGRLVPRIIKAGSLYYLFYSSGLIDNDEAIGKAVSNDGLNFTKDTNNPIFSINDGLAWRNNRTYTAWIIWDTDHWRMYYTGKSAAGVYSVGTAVNYGGL